MCTSYESHTFFHEFAKPELIKQISEKKDTFITCCTHYIFLHIKKS
jgi:glutamate racemase